MRRRIPVLFVVLAFLVAVSSLGWADDNNPGNSPQSGYAIVTPTGSNTGGLVVFETYGESHGNAALQAGVLPANMTTNALLFVDTSLGLQRNMGVAIANPGTTAANITLTLFKQDGTTVTTQTVTVPPGNQTAQFVTSMFPGNPDLDMGFVGTLQITSDNPVAVVGLRFRGENFSTIPVTDLSPATPVPQVTPEVGGPDAVILPQFATGGGWATEIVLQNSGTAPLTVRVDLFNQTGGALNATLNGQTGSSFTNLTIPPNGVVVLAPGNGEGDDEF